MEIEITIDEATGDMLLPRDHEVIVKLAKELNLSPEELEAFTEFFNQKPKNAKGETNYPSFCG